MQWRKTLSFPSPDEVVPVQWQRQRQQQQQQEVALFVSDQRTLYLVNIFIVNMVRFLNRFSALCEEKLAHVHRRILQLDASLTLLEAQLTSIDWNKIEEHCSRSEDAGSSK
ncbi:PREDICTED: WASH complex subunit CCDC53-like [Nelumbo nucifera]|uniref:WASH complex subunit CCDC53-like n=1 Tax=Nelumbo nucifera TaxID=4432 RepID=A0A1U7Z9Y3_NELNU|nr:PREDICTED: WASH complex subunit CCDC53-like [Nelumbo nucifera]